MKSRYKPRSSRRYARPKKRRTVARKNPSAKPVMNKQGGVYPTTTFELIRARVVDLVTLPGNIQGTNCGNCRYAQFRGSKIGFCKHPLVKEPITRRMCCGVWDAPGTLRSKKAVSNA